MFDDGRPGSFDVVVIGGGAAGIAAAVGAAQSGATVCLVEQYGFLGGAATNSSVLTHCGFFDQTKTQVVKGVGQQFLDKLDERSIYQTETFEHTGNTVVLLDLETTKSVYDELTVSAGVALYLHSQLISATAAGGTITDVEIAHRGGRERIFGRAFIDCSGDGALIAASGADHVVSNVSERQASTLVMRAGGVVETADLSTDGMIEAVRKYREQTGTTLVRDNGIAVRMPVSREVMLLLADQHRDVLDVRELTRAEVESRRLSWHYLEAFRKFLAGWDSSFLAATGPQIGIRESRRLKGRDTVGADDVHVGRKRPEDAIARCGWPMEDHVAPGVTTYGGIKDKGWYHISYGAICSASTDNLWAGGRLVSSDNRAYASLRVMGTAFATGHACGAAAAVYAAHGRHDYALTRQLLDEQGALI
ncbi:MAG: FAD-dependent oxidoreductase [Lacisediminihabitans sp.]